jgi:hypothetical protein
MFELAGVPALIGLGFIAAGVSGLVKARRP